MSPPSETPRRRPRAPAASAAPAISPGIAGIARLALREQRDALEGDLGARQEEHAALAKVVSALRKAVAARIAIIDREHPLLVEEGESGDVDFLMAVARSRSQKIHEIIGEKVQAAIDAFLELNGPVEGLKKALAALDDAAAVIQEVGGAVRRTVSPAASMRRGGAAAGTADIAGAIEGGLATRPTNEELPETIMVYVRGHEGRIRLTKSTLGYFRWPIGSKAGFIRALDALAEAGKLRKVVDSPRNTHYDLVAEESPGGAA